MSAHVLAFCPRCERPITWLGFEHKDLDGTGCSHVVAIGICSFGLSGCDCTLRGGGSSRSATADTKVSAANTFIECPARRLKRKGAAKP